MNDIKHKIESLVTAYKRVCATEYRDFIDGHKTVVKTQDNKFSEMKHNEIVTRALWEIPQTLQAIFMRQLTDDEYQYLRSRKGSIWFARLYPEFRIPEKV